MKRKNNLKRITFAYNNTYLVHSSSIHKYHIYNIWVVHSTLFFKLQYYISPRLKIVNQFPKN